MGNNFRSRPYSRELLANLIYGSSYASLDSALQYHGLIPEQVETVTSVTTGHTRAFDTPVGRFNLLWDGDSYLDQRLPRYSR